MKFFEATFGFLFATIFRRKRKVANEKFKKRESVARGSVGGISVKAIEFDRRFGFILKLGIQTEKEYNEIKNYFISKE